jgi:hypothetical protein
MSTSTAGFEYQSPADHFPMSGPPANLPLYGMESQQNSSAYGLSLPVEMDSQRGSIESSGPPQDRVMSASSSELSFNQGSSQPVQQWAVIRSRGASDAPSKHQKQHPSQVRDIGAREEVDESEERSLPSNKRARKNTPKTANSDEDGSRKKHRGRPKITTNGNESIDVRHPRIRSKPCSQSFSVGEHRSGKHNEPIDFERKIRSMVCPTSVIVSSRLSTI